MTVVNKGAAGIDGAIDNPLFEVDVAYRTYMNTGDITLLSKTLNNGSTLVNGLVSLMNGVPRSNGMVYVASGIGYGFQDTVTVTGNDFYCSLLDVQASNQLAALLTATGNTSAAATWTAAAKAETTDIQNTFCNSSEGMFMPRPERAATTSASGGRRLRSPRAWPRPASRRRSPIISTTTTRTWFWPGRSGKYPVPPTGRALLGTSGERAERRLLGSARGASSRARSPPSIPRWPSRPFWITATSSIRRRVATPSGTRVDRQRQRGERRPVLLCERDDALGHCQAVHAVCSADAPVDEGALKQLGRHRLGLQGRGGICQDSSVRPTRPPT